MKNDNKMIIIGLVFSAIFLASAFLSGCLDHSKFENSSDFEVHEWGVFLQEYNCSVVQLLNLPLPGFVYYARKPVIYFHTVEDINYVTVEVEISENLTTIPNATIVGDKIQWTFAIENNSVLLQDGSNYDYLFYEGDIICSQAIIAYVNVSDGNATFYIRNIADYNLTDVFFILGLPSQVNLFSISVNYIHIDNLESGEEKIMTIPLKFDSDYETNTIKESLIQMGLTEKEADELINYWAESWFYPSNVKTFAHIIYAIPQEIYDELLPISITPLPATIKRIGIFFITNITINSLNNSDAIVDDNNLSEIPIGGGIKLDIIKSEDKNETNVILTTNTIYPCCNYLLNSSLNIAGSKLLIDIHNIIEPEICLTALGQARWEKNLGNITGEFDLTIRYKHDIYGEYKLTITDKNITLTS